MTIGLLALIILAVSLAFGLAPRRLAGRMTESQLADMTGVASGLLLASALLVVVPEGFHTAGEAAEADDAFAFEPAILGGTVLVGFVVMLVLEGFGIGHDVHEEHHGHRDGHGHGHVHHPASSTMLALGLSLHAAADGLAIGAATAIGETTFSVLVALAVLIHRVPAAFSLGLFVAHEAIDHGRAVRGIALFSLATPATMLVSALALDGADEGVLALVLLFSAGTFLYVATVDTLPAMHNPETGRRSLRNVVIGVLAFGVLVLGADAAGLLEHSH